MSGYKKSINEEVDRVYEKVFLSDFETVWQSTLEALKSSALDTSNREAGFIRTKWIDNTAQKNFADSFGTGQMYLKAQYRTRVTVGKLFYNGKPAVKVNIQKEQLVQNDVLEGWRSVTSDGVDEQTMLYRVGRLIVMSTKRQKIEEQRTQEQIKDQLKEEAKPEPVPESEPEPSPTN